MRGRNFLRLSQLLAAITGNDIEVWDGQMTQLPSAARNEKDKGRMSYINWRCDMDKDMLTAMKGKPYGHGGNLKTQPPNWSFLVNVDNKCKGSLLRKRFSTDLKLFNTTQQNKDALSGALFTSSILIPEFV